MAAAMPMSATAQQPGRVRPVIDTVIVEVDNVFGAEEATSSGKRFMNTIHVPTKQYVILHQLLLSRGDPYDSLLAAESERNLRLLGLFSTIAVDTVRLDGALALRVRAQDGVSLMPT
jgi:outer membrane protein assembly factor BamA